jgi:hypothetical protein
VVGLGGLEDPQGTGTSLPASSYKKLRVPGANQPKPDTLLYVTPPFHVSTAPLESKAKGSSSGSKSSASSWLLIPSPPAKRTYHVLSQPDISCATDRVLQPS